MNEVSLVASTNRTWIQWSLRSVLVAILLLCVSFSWWGAKIRKKSRIERALQLIAAASNWQNGFNDPTSLVRAVNGLHTLGKEEAIEALRKYAAQNPDDGTQSPSCLRFILPILFDRADPEDQLIFRDWTYFPTFCLVSGDIPFYHHSDVRSASWPFEKNIADEIDLAEKRGRLRSTPLRPVDNPLNQVDSILDGPLGSSYFSETRKTNKQFLRAQAYRAIAALVSPDQIGVENWPFEDDVKWLRLKDVVEELNIHWSETHQCYVSSPIKE